MRWIWWIGLIFSTPVFAATPVDWEMKPYALEQENFFDLLSYQYPAVIDRQFHQASSGMRATVGSLSQERFYQHQELVLDQPLNPQVGIGYRYFDESIYRPNAPNQEVYFRFGLPWRVDVIGFPDHVKSEGDLGLALGYGLRHSPLYLRYSRLFQETLYNEKNVPDDLSTVSDQAVTSPVVDRLELTYQANENLYLDLDLQHQQTARHRWVHPAQVKTVQSSAQRGRFEWGGDSVWGVKFHRQLEHRTNQQAGESSQTNQKIGFSWAESYHRFLTGKGNYLTVGAQSGAFSNQINGSDPELDYQTKLATEQAYAQWVEKREDQGQWFTSLQVGQAHRTKFFDLKQQIDDQGVQAKASVGYIWSESSQWWLYVNSTWDLDFARYRQWDGGNLQLFFAF